MNKKCEKQEAYAKYQNYTNKTLWQMLENYSALTEVEIEVIKMILDGRKK